MGTTIFAEMSALATTTGSVNLGQGFPDTDGPPEIAAAAARAIMEGRGNQYPPGPGISELRQAIAAHQKRFYGIDLDPDTQVLVTAGATEAIAAALIALLEPGDEAIAFEPYYDSYAACIAMSGATRVPVTLRPPDFRPDLDALRAAITSRTRLILLNTHAWAAILELRERIKFFYGTEPQPDWYAFASGEGQGPRIGSNKTTVKPDPVKPIKGWRSGWRKIACAAGLPGLRFHDLRHHAITELAEGQASDQTIRSIAGHVSQRMLEHHSHVGLGAKRKALRALAPTRGEENGPGYVTNCVTKSSSETPPAPQRVEDNGGHDGTRTRGLCRTR